MSARSPRGLSKSPKSTRSWNANGPTGLTGRAV
jgi:hypothetical protein